MPQENLESLAQDGIENTSEKLEKLIVVTLIEDILDAGEIYNRIKSRATI